MKSGLKQNGKGALITFCTTVNPFNELHESQVTYCCHMGVLCMLLSHGSAVHIVVTWECCLYCCHMGVLFILLSHGSAVHIKLLSHWSAVYIVVT